jgi:hypothetical protein
MYYHSGLNSHISFRMLSYLNVRDKKQKQTHGLSLLKINRK